MSPDDFAARHPRLFHVTRPTALPLIERHGLLPTSTLLTLFGVPDADRVALEARRRPGRVRLTHATHGEAILTDNLPLTEAALARCLDDGLSPETWLRMLNARVFFWPDERGLAGFLAARFNRDRERLVLVLDSRRLLLDCGARAELTAINTGATLRKPARRGLATFTPLGRCDYAAWRRLRGRLDRVREVAVAGPVPGAMAYVVDRYVVPPAGGRAADRTDADAGRP